MNKIKSFIKKLSLCQQLIVMLCFVGLLIVMIMIPLVDYNLKSIIDNHMYDTLSSEQDMIMNNTSFVPRGDKKKSIHMIYDSSLNMAISSNLMKQEDFNVYYKHIIGEPLEKLLNQSYITSVNGKTEFIEDTYYYMISRLSSNRYLISMQNSDYSNELIATIRNQVIYIQYIFFLLVSVILIVWVISLISPLRKIKEYIDNIKYRKEMKLNIERDDEIGVVYKALVEMKNELCKQDKIKEEMIHNMSHDLKTPIALIKTYGQSVKDDIYPYGDKDSSMDIIIENAERLDHKVKSFLYLNRLDYLNNENTVLNPLPLKGLIEKIVEQFKTLNTDIHFTTELEDISFIGEEEHWRVAIENIIDNASRYAKETVKIVLKENYLEIYNDGDPIVEQNILDLFKPYVKGTKGQFGLGLSIVYKIVTMYGFNVTAYNKDDGVSFIIKKHLC